MDIANKRELCDIYIDLTENINNLLLLNSEVDTKEYITTLIKLLNDTLLTRYEEKSIRILIFNESLIYNGILTDNFYDLYKIINPKVIYSNKFIKLLENIIRKCKPIKKGNRCKGCLLPVSFIKTGNNIKKICYICRKIQQFKEEIHRISHIKNKDMIYEFTEYNRKLHNIREQDKTYDIKKILHTEISILLNNVIYNCI
jgi:hypothetical protein